MTLISIKQISLVYTLLILSLLVTPIKGVAEVIYEWTDPWGQIQYSKTPVPGSRVSEVTRLPKIRDTSEQLKKQAMANKLRQMNAINLRRKENVEKNRLLRKQRITEENYCSKLRTLLTDIRLRINRTHAGLITHPVYLPGSFLLNSAYYQTQEEDILRELRQNCR